MRVIFRRISKKREGYKRSIILSKEYNLYRQDYCGCIFSKGRRRSEKRLYGHKSGCGSEKKKPALANVIEKFNQNGYCTEVYITQKSVAVEDYVAEHCQKAIWSFAAAETEPLNNVVNGIIRAEIDIPLGYIPAGSTNDFAAGLSLPSNPRRRPREFSRVKRTPMTWDKSTATGGLSMYPPSELFPRLPT